MNTFLFMNSDLIPLQSSWRCIRKWIRILITLYSS